MASPPDSEKVCSSPVCDDSDSDDSLSDGPEFLSRNVSAGFENPADAGQGAVEQSGNSSEQSTTYSLDSLLQDAKNALAEQQRNQEVQMQLDKDSLSLSEENDEMEATAGDEENGENFTDEQKNTLKMLKLEEEKIQDSPPGEAVLKDQYWGQLFTDTVGPASLGATFDSPSFYHLLGQYQPDTLMTILSSDILSLAYQSLPCKTEIQQWLFLIMSVHSGAAEVEKCADQLLKILQCQMRDVLQGKEKYTFAPPLLDIFRIFVNWGADQRDLIFAANAINCEQLNEILPLSGSLPEKEVSHTCQRNICQVLKMLSCWLQARPNYKTEELNQLLMMICRLLLDPSFCRSYHLLFDIQVCLASVLECYQPSQWKTVVPWLCRKLSCLSGHHHNQVYIARLFAMSNVRGLYLQQRVAYLILHSSLTNKELTNQQILDFKLLDLLPLIAELKYIIQSDNYRLSSLVRLLDLCVGPAAQYVSQRKHLFRVLQAVNSTVSEIRDSVQRLDCTKVKGMLLHLCLKWNLSIKASNIKQRKIFNCFASKTQVQVEQLEDQSPTSNDAGTDGMF